MLRIRDNQSFTYNGLAQSWKCRVDILEYKGSLRDGRSYVLRQHINIDRSESSKTHLEDFDRY